LTPAVPAFFALPDVAARGTRQHQHQPHQIVAAYHFKLSLARAEAIFKVDMPHPCALMS
jgi:hypothetical protein